MEHTVTFNQLINLKNGAVERKHVLVVPLLRITLHKHPSDIYLLLLQMFTLFVFLHGSVYKICESNCNVKQIKTYKLLNKVMTFIE